MKLGSKHDLGPRSNLDLSGILVEICKFVHGCDLLGCLPLVVMVLVDFGLFV